MSSGTAALTLRQAAQATGRTACTAEAPAHAEPPPQQPHCAPLVSLSTCSLPYSTYLAYLLWQRMAHLLGITHCRN